MKMNGCDPTAFSDSEYGKFGAGPVIKMTKTINSVTKSHYSYQKSYYSEQGQ